MASSSSALDITPENYDFLQLINHPFDSLSPYEKITRLHLTQRLSHAAKTVTKNAINDTHQIEACNYHIIALLAMENFTTLLLAGSFLLKHKENKVLWEKLCSSPIITRLNGILYPSLEEFSNNISKKIISFNLKNHEFKDKKITIREQYRQWAENPRKFDKIKIEFENLHWGLEYYHLALQLKDQDSEVTLGAFYEAIKICPHLESIECFAADFMHSAKHSTKKNELKVYKESKELQAMVKDSMESVLRKMNIQETDAHALLTTFRFEVTALITSWNTNPKYQSITETYRRQTKQDKYLTTLRLTSDSLQLLDKQSNDFNPERAIKLIIAGICNYTYENTQSLSAITLDEVNIIRSMIRLVEAFGFVKLSDKAADPKFRTLALNIYTFALWLIEAVPKFIKLKVTNKADQLLYDEAIVVLQRMQKEIAPTIITLRSKLLEIIALPETPKNNSIQLEVKSDKQKKKKKKKKNKLNVPPANPFKAPQVIPKKTAQDDLEKKEHQEFLHQQQKEAAARKEETQQLKIQQELLKKQKIEADKKAQELLRQAKNAELRLKEELTEQKRAEEADFLRAKEAARLKLVSDLREKELAGIKLRKEKELEFNKKASARAKRNKYLLQTSVKPFKGAFKEIQSSLQLFLKNNFNEHDIYYVVGGYVRFALGFESILNDIDILASFGQYGTLKKSKVNRIPNQIVVADSKKVAIEKTYKKQTKLGDFTTLKEESDGRDFTFSALYLDHLALGKSKIEEKDVIDPTGKGITDLRSHILRTILEVYASPDENAQLEAAKKSLENDPKRVVRAAVFMLREDKPLKPTTALARALQESAHLFLPWRLDFDRDHKYKYKFESLLKKLMGENTFKVFNQLHDWGVIQVLFPEFEEILKKNGMEMLSQIKSPTIYKYIAHLIFELVKNNRSNKHRLLSDPRPILEFEFLSASAISWFADKNPLLKHLLEIKPYDLRLEWNQLVASHRAKLAKAPFFSSGAVDAVGSVEIETAVGLNRK